jgi:hypothetical protein
VVEQPVFGQVPDKPGETCYMQQMLCTNMAFLSKSSERIAIKSIAYNPVNSIL